MSFLRRLPADVRKALVTEPGERVLTFAATGDGHVVATNLAPTCPAGSVCRTRRWTGPPGTRRG